MKKFWKNNKVFIIIVLLFVAFILLTLFLGDSVNVANKSNKDKFDLSVVSKNVKTWADATEEDKYVVTVLAQTTCSHCLNYKPVITALQKEYGFELYWFEMDELYQTKEEDYKTVEGYYTLKDYKGTPYTFITKAGELVKTKSGEMSSESLKEFLIKQNVIAEK